MACLAVASGVVVVTASSGLSGRCATVDLFLFRGAVV